MTMQFMHACVLPVCRIAVGVVYRQDAIHVCVCVASADVYDLLELGVMQFMYACKSSDK